MGLQEALDVLKTHHIHFFEGLPYATMTAHPVPEDSRAWSQILISVLTDIRGVARHKGQDLEDGSDVKAANAWCSIDTVRFNGVIKAGTQSHLSGSLAYLDQMPFLFFVLWDYNPRNDCERARIWVVQPQCDGLFRQIARDWYYQRANGMIKSDNFQLHPPVNKNNDIITNQCGDLVYPLLLSAEWDGAEYQVIHYDSDVLRYGHCVEV